MRFLPFLLTFLTAAPALAQMDAVDVGPIEAITVQDRQTLKTLDTYARQRLAFITGRGTLDDRAPTWTLLDMAYRPEAYAGRNLIKIKHLPLRLDLAGLSMLDEAERERLKEKGTISAVFLKRDDVQAAMVEIQRKAVHKSDAINQLFSQAQALDELLQVRLLPGATIPPVLPEDTIWKPASALLGNAPMLVAGMRANAISVPAALPGYDGQRVEAVLLPALELGEAWRLGNPTAAETAIGKIARSLPRVVPEAYPSEARRKGEIIYNRLGKGTLLGAAFYFAAFTLLLLRGVVGQRGFGIAGLALFVIAFLIHTAAIGVRWWLVEKSTGSWFYSIPIKNQFESVLMSAWFGALVGLVLESWKRNGFFGAAASFVGWLSLVALFAVPYVFGKDIGGEIGQVGGILMSYWLYIHVTLVVASYALIGMTFLLGVTWLVGKCFGVARPTLTLIDQSNIVLLQLAFWVLGTGIICGAVWADVSWGRPWGWDPKETFALVTWLVYLIIVHVRIVTPNKAAWTSGLAVVGFFVMLFNWIGVNFFLVGLHSYA